MKKWMALALAMLLVAAAAPAAPVPEDGVYFSTYPRLDYDIDYPVGKYQGDMGGAVLDLRGTE